MKPGDPPQALPQGSADGFRPGRLSVGGHRQTLLGYWSRRRLRWPYPVENVVVEAGAGVRLLVCFSGQAVAPEERPTVVVLHGLGGSADGSYSISLGRLAFCLGWNVARVNLRGAGASFELCPKLYNAGLDSDLLAVLAALAARTPRLAVAGFSLGGNITALAAGRGAARLPPGVFAMAAVSAPFDLAACVAALEAPGNRVYQAYYLRQLKADYRQRQRLRPDLYEAGRERTLRTIRDYDERITAPHGGFRDADDYYDRSSSGPHLARVERPLLVLAAADDPLIPVASVTAWPGSSAVRREVAFTGGHVGFFAPARAPGRFWAADRLMAFFAERA